MLPDYSLAMGAHPLLSISTLIVTAILLSCPVVRIGPREVHFSDPLAYSQIYNVSSRFTKCPDFYHCFGAGDSAFGVMDPATSKLRRAILHPFFSRKAMSHLEPVIQAKVNELLAQIVNSKDQTINMFLAYRALTLDIITLYVFGQSLHAMHIPGFCSSFLLDIQNALPMLWIIKAFPSSTRLLGALPQSWSDRAFPAFTAFMGVRQAIISWVLSTTTTEEKGGESPDYVAIYRQLRGFESPGKQQVFASQETLVDEAVSLLQAGSDTVASACTIGTTYILRNPAVRDKLVKELESVWRDGEESVDLTVLESLPYLTAVIKESLRLSHGFVTPLPRVVGPPGAVIGGVHIPEGSIVSMSVAVLHLNPHIFHNPHEFIPERWLSSSGGDEHNQLDRFLVAFSRGPRMCLGIHLAWAELYTIFAVVFRKLDMDLVSPRSDDDLQEFKDYFVPVHDGDSQLRVKVTSVRP